FSGFTGNLLQEDIVTQVSMGSIVDRTHEHLSSSDVAIIHARRALLTALDRIAAGHAPIGDALPADLRHLEPIDRIDAPGAAA
ncbi:MAG: Rieske (2Fe-2S) protein, partial [Gammaproteobacteria bacterium]